MSDSYPGFASPNYTPVPDEIFDALMPTLSGAELKVLLYICRRTFGFRKESDSISLGQLCSGITTHDGRVLDSGTGLSRSAVVEALKSLAVQGIILATKHSSAQRGNETTTYELHFRDGVTPWSRKTTSPSRISAPPLVVKSDPQETVDQETVEQEIVSSNLRMANPPESSVVHGKAPGVVAPPVYDESRQVLLSYVEDFARELGDRASLRSSTTRAANLYRDSGRSLDSFAELMLQARAQTQERSAAIHSARVPGEKRVKMAYFFACLEKLVGQAPAG